MQSRDGAVFSYNRWYNDSCERVGRNMREGKRRESKRQQIDELPLALFLCTPVYRRQRCLYDWIRIDTTKISL